MFPSAFCVINERQRIDKKGYALREGRRVSFFDDSAHHIANTAAVNDSTTVERGRDGVPSPACSGR